MNKPFLFALVLPAGLLCAADPDIQRALDDALQRHPPGDYQNFIPRLHSVPALVPAKPAKTVTFTTPDRTLHGFQQEVARINETLPRLPAQNPFEKPIELFPRSTATPRAPERR